MDNFNKKLPNIVFFGRSRSGKDYAYKYVAQKGYHVQRVAYGDALKEKFYEMFPQFIDKPKPMKEIIHFGQSMRFIDQDIWVNLAIGSIKVHEMLYSQYGIDKPSYIFTDVRQQNEYEACKELGCVFVRIMSPLHQRVERMTALGEKHGEEALNANTERELEGFDYDYLITNSGTLEDFEKKIDEILEKIIARS